MMIAQSAFAAVSRHGMAMVAMVDGGGNFAIVVVSFEWSTNQAQSAKVTNRLTRK